METLGRRRQQMKKIKMIYKWILISVILQTAFLSWLNFIYLPGRGQFRSTMYETELHTVRDRSYRLPEGASDISVSFDGLYAAFRLDEEIVVADLDSGEEIKRLGPDGGEFTYHRWLPDREMLIYAIKEPEGESGRVRISTYDVVPGLDRSYPDIKELPEGSGVIDIELSPMTNIVYPMIKTSNTRARVYRFDIMDNLSLIFKTDLTTVIKETMYTDNLVYQLAGERISIRNGHTGKTIYIPVKEANLLLDIDGSDVLYAGAADKSGGVTAIYYGRIGTESAGTKAAGAGKPGGEAASGTKAAGTGKSGGAAASGTKAADAGKSGGAAASGTKAAGVGKSGSEAASGTRAAGSEADGWDSIQLSRPVAADDIIITADGTVYIADRQNGIVECIKHSNGRKDLPGGTSGGQDGTAQHNHKPIKYKGQLLTMLDRYIVYLDDNDLVLRTLEK